MSSPQHSVSVSQFPPVEGERERGVPLVETGVEEVALGPVEPGEEGVDGDGRQHGPPLIPAQVLGPEPVVLTCCVYMLSANPFLGRFYRVFQKYFADII